MPASLQNAISVANLGRDGTISMSQIASFEPNG
jgi:hypothetical protein